MKPTHPHTNKVEKIRSAYDSTAEFYDARYRHLQFLKYAFLLPSLIDRSSSPHLRIKGPILDSGGGTGLFQDFLLKFQDFLSGKEITDEKTNTIMDFARFNLPEKSIHNDNRTTIIEHYLVVCDVSFEMLRVARDTPDYHSIYGLVACDSSYLPFRDKIFPTVTAFTVFQNIVDVKHGIEEVYRILADGGILGVSLLKKTSNKLKFAGLLGVQFQKISPIFVERMLEDFQKLIVQSDKYSPFHDLEKVEDFFLTAQKIPGNQK